MKFNELFTSADGIFTVFEKSFPTDFATLFGNLTPTVLNSFALGLYGKRVLFDYVTADSWELYVETCIAMNLSNWMRLNSALTTPYDVTTGYKTEHTKTGTENITVSEDNESLSAKKPFNGETFDDDERQQKTQSKSEDRTYNLADTTTHSNGGAAVADSIEKEIEVRRHNLQRQIIAELVADVAISIYE